jgi:hypothetical protein
MAGTGQSPAPNQTPAAQWPSMADIPNHSYGIAEDFHPTSFEIYRLSLIRGRGFVKFAIRQVSPACGPI